MEEISLKSIIIGLVASFLYWWYSLSYMPDWVLGVNRVGNVKAYIIFCLIFMSICLVSIIVQRRLNRDNFKHNLIISALTYILFALAAVDLIRDNVVMTNRMGFLIEVLVIVFSFMIIARLYEKNIGILDSERFLIVIFVTIVALVWYQNIASNNIFCNTYSAAGFDTYYNVHHSSAYIDSIYAACYNSPFVGGLTEQYGHYALFFIVPMKIFGASVNTIGKTLGVISGISGGLITYSFFKIFKNDVTKILFGILMIGAGMFPAYIQIYWQTYPQRFFIPAVTIWYITYICEKELKVKHYIVGMLIMCLGFLWSTDSGLVSTACYLVFLFIKNIIDSVLNAKLVLKLVIIEAINIIVILLGALGLANVYNLIVGGEPLSFIDYLTLDNEGYIQSLQYPIEFWNTDYNYKLIIMLTVLAFTMYALLFKFSEDSYKRNIYLMTNALMGLGMMTYYINRPIAGNTMIYPYLYVSYLSIFELFDVKLTGEGIGRIKDSVINNIKYGFIIISFICVFAECQGYIRGFQQANFKNQAGAYNYDAIINSANEIKEYLDDDVVGIGIGTSALFFEMEIDKKSYRFDTLDMDNAWNGNQVFMWRGYEPEFLPDNYVLTREFLVNDMPFGLYEEL